jgi:curved DNA-binding protein CbpA
MPDYYEILAIPRNATAGEVRKAYARLAKERHPDRFLDPVEKERASEFFKDLTAAYNTLGNERNRQAYDAESERPRLVGPEEIANGAYETGLQMFESRDYHGAVEHLRTAVHHMPREPRYHAALARALARNPNWAREAIQHMETAAQLAPRAASYHAELARLFHAQGLKLRARKALETAYQLGPKDPEVLRVVSEVFDENDDGPGEGGGGLRGLLRRKP